MSDTIVQTDQSNKAMLDKEGKYLTFALGPEQYGLEILKVREIIGYGGVMLVEEDAHITLDLGRD